LRRGTLLVVLAGLCAGVVAPPAVAGKRKVPRGFFSVVVPPDFARLGPAVLDQQAGLMAASGVETARLSIAWGALEPARGRYNFGALDSLIGAMARHHVASLVNVSETAPWDVQTGGSASTGSPPRDPDLFAKLFRQLVLRYGPRGSFWSEHPTIPRVPVREWQVWNEQNAIWNFRVRPWAPRYVKLLKASYRAIHRADRGAKVVAGSLVGAGDSNPWSAMRDLYRAGGKRYFDEVSIHPYTNDGGSVKGTATQVIEIVSFVRAVMRRHGDARKPVLITELTWASAAGQVPQQAEFGLVTTAKGQAQRLTAAYRGLAKRRRSLRIREVHWYEWASTYTNDAPASTVLFSYTGLVRVQGSLVSPMPILGVFTRVARQWEGCRKTTSARCR
jgi:hypothetical protein